MLHAALFIASVLIPSLDCFAQAENLPPVASRPTVEKPLTSDERAELLKLIRSLQERLDKLEAAQPATTTPATMPTANPPTPVPNTSLQPTPEPTPEPTATTPANNDDDENDWTYGRYTPNFGFKVVNTEYGDLNISVYTYARYLNQLGLS